jgi:hypothetical protein
MGNPNRARHAEREDRKARARVAAKELLVEHLDESDFQIDYDAHVGLPWKGGDNGAWVTVKVWVRLDR